MRKKYTLLLLATAALLAFGGCGKTDSDKLRFPFGDGKELPSVIITDDEEIPEKTPHALNPENKQESSEGSEDSESEETEETEEIDPEEEAQALYKSFQEGKGQLFFENCMQKNADGNFFNVNKGYNLIDIVTAFYGRYSRLFESPRIRYQQIDFGNDGSSELAVEFIGMGIDAINDNSTLTYIIKAIDGKLQLIHYYENHNNSLVRINEHGYYYTSDVNTPSRHSGDIGFYDENGEGQLLYHYIEEAYLPDLHESPELENLAAVASQKEITAVIAVQIYTVDEDTYYSFAVIGDDMPAERLYTDSVYKQVFDEAGVKITTPSEFNEIIEKKLERFAIEKFISLYEESLTPEEIEALRNPEPEEEIKPGTKKPTPSPTPEDLTEEQIELREKLEELKKQMLGVKTGKNIF
ncbi:MAG: hypothetical protein J5898_02000 [Lachnospiraceae bacterium]|nr:hypothetical protein [Lachnospiraceae bacterium]